MAKDINIHLKTTGAAQTKEQLDQVGRSAEGVGSQAQEGGRKGAAGMDSLGQSVVSTEGRFGKLTSAIGSWLLRFASITAIIAGVRAAINAANEAMKESVEIAERHQKKLLSLQYLGEMFKERPELRKEVAAYAEFGRRPFEEVAQAWYSLRSKAARLPAEQRQAILREALELGRTQPEVRLDTIVDMFSLYAKLTKQRDMNLVQNVIQQTITEAGGTGTDVAKYMPMFLPTAQAGGLTGPEAAGLWSYITTQMAEASIATTGLQRVFMALQGQGTPESQRLLGGLGIKPDMGFFEKIKALSARYEGGRFGLKQAQVLAGEAGASVLLAILQNQQEMMETIGNVVSAARSDIDITRNMIDELMSTDQVARLEEERRRLKVAIENLKATDVSALQWDTLILEYEKRMREAGLPEAVIDLEVWIEQQKAYLGAKPGTWELKMGPFGGRPVEFPRPSKLGVPAEAGPQQLEVPIEPETVPPVPQPAEPGEMGLEHVEVPVLQEISAKLDNIGRPQVSHHYDNGMHFYPVVGDDERGPRFTQL